MEIRKRKSQNSGNIRRKTESESTEYDYDESIDREALELLSKDHKHRKLANGIPSNRHTTINEIKITKENVKVVGKQFQGQASDGLANAYNNVIESYINESLGLNKTSSEARSNESSSSDDNLYRLPDNLRVEKAIESTELSSLSTVGIAEVLVSSSKDRSATSSKTVSLSNESSSTRMTSLPSSSSSSQSRFEVRKQDHVPVGDGKSTDDYVFRKYLNASKDRMRR